MKIIKSFDENRIFLKLVLKKYNFFTSFSQFWTLFQRLTIQFVVL
jgi:hypothetical protein